MKRIQERKLSMYEVTQQHVDDLAQVSAISQMPQFEFYKTELGKVILRIKETGAIQVQLRSGISSDKQLRRDAATALGLRVSKAVKAFAVNSGNATLAESMNYGVGKFSKMADNIFVMHLVDIALAAEAILPQLIGYHVDAALLADLEVARISFDDYIPKPRGGIVVRKDATDKLRFLFADADALLSKMDVLADVIALDEPEFYSTYRNSRILVDAGFRKLALRGFIGDANGLPLEKVTVNIKGTPIKAVSTAKGNFRIKDLAAGVYDVVLQKPGFEDVLGTIGITDLMRTDVDFRMTVL